MSGEGAALDWGALVPRLVYPTKLLIIEAIWWIERPLSATELEQIFEDEKISQSSFSYHVNTLVTFDILLEDSSRQVRGGIERFYAFTDAVLGFS